MFQQLVGNISAPLAQMGRCPAEIDGVPMDDGADHEVEAGSTECLTVKGAITDFAALVEEDGALELVRGFALVETGLDLSRNCAGHLSVLSWQQEISEMMKHSEDFKREAVRIALSSGLSRERVAADLGVGKSTLGKWISHHRPADLVAQPQADLARENERLRLENRILKEERDILKNDHGLWSACAR